MVDIKKYPYVMKHYSAPLGSLAPCMKDAFFLTHKLTALELLSADYVQHLDGRPAIALERICCDTCGGIVDLLPDYIEERFSKP